MGMPVPQSPQVPSTTDNQVGPVSGDSNASLGPTQGTSVIVPGPSELLRAGPFNLGTLPHELHACGQQPL